MMGKVGCSGCCGQSHIPSAYPKYNLQNVHVFLCLFAWDIFCPKEYGRPNRAKTRSEADNTWIESNTPFLTAPPPSVQQFWDSFHIVSQKVPAQLCPVAHNTHLNYWLSHLSCLNTPLSGLPFTLTTFMQILESGPAFIVTHTKILRNNFLWEPWGNNLHFCRIVWA